jgi:hypothetical protein
VLRLVSNLNLGRSLVWISWGRRLNRHVGPWHVVLLLLHLLGMLPLRLLLLLLYLRILALGVISWLRLLDLREPMRNHRRGSRSDDHGSQSVSAVANVCLIAGDDKRGEVDDTGGGKGA